MADKPKIIVDLNKVNRKEYIALLQALEKANTLDEKSAASGAFAEATIAEWPYDQPITADGYDSLGMIDVSDVDDALTTAIAELASKNLARRSISLANSSKS